MSRTHAYDAVFAAIKQLPKTLQVASAGILFMAIDSLPMDNTRHLRFLSAINLINSHPVDVRYTMVDQLQESIWCQPSFEAKLHCLDEFLMVLRSQPAIERQRAYGVLYDASFDTYEDSSRFAMLRTIAREVTQLPQAEQPELLICAAHLAREIKAPYIAFLYNDIVQAISAIPPDTRDDTLGKIARHLEHVVNSLIYYGNPNGELPALFHAVLGTIDVLPEVMQVALLAQLKQSLTLCPAGSLADASTAISKKMNVLPLYLIEQFLDLKPA